MRKAYSPPCQRSRSAPSLHSLGRTRYSKQKAFSVYRFPILYCSITGKVLILSCGAHLLRRRRPSA
jgi:hypothetical protein